MKVASKTRIAVWIARLAFVIVCFWNLQCAFSFVIAPQDFVSGFQLSTSTPAATAASVAAVQGLGVAFLMWNATYPAFIISPARFKALGWVILAQQAIGLIGESFIYFGLGDGMGILASSILRFIAFDAAGLVIMGAAFAFLMACMRKDASGYTCGASSCDGILDCEDGQHVG